MTQTEILAELEKLAPLERLRVIETALHLITEELEPSAVIEKKRQMAIAARTLLLDYTSDIELTAFTALDNEEFHA